MMTQREQFEKWYEFIASLDFKDLQDLSIETLIAMGWQAAQQCGDGEAYVEVVTGAPSAIKWVRINNLPDGTLLFTYPPDQLSKIKELEAKITNLQQALDAYIKEII